MDRWDGDDWTSSQHNQFHPVFHVENKLETIKLQNDSPNGNNNQTNLWDSQQYNSCVGISCVDPISPFLFSSFLSCQSRVPVLTRSSAAAADQQFWTKPCPLVNFLTTRTRTTSRSLILRFPYSFFPLILLCSLSLPDQHSQRKETIINNKRKRKRETNIVRLHLGSCEPCDSTARWAPINYENKKRKEEISSRYVFVVSVVVFACQRHTHLPRFSYYIPSPSPRYPLPLLLLEVGGLAVKKSNSNYKVVTPISTAGPFAPVWCDGPSCVKMWTCRVEAQLACVVVNTRLYCH
jgi:hypothetical protein